MSRPPRRWSRGGGRNRATHLHFWAILAHFCHRSVRIAGYRHVSVRSGLVLIRVLLLDVGFAASWTCTSARVSSQPATTKLHNSSHHPVIATKLGILFRLITGEHPLRHWLAESTLACLDLDTTMLRKSAPVYHLENTKAEIGAAKLVALIVLAAELAIWDQPHERAAR
jgi:hypothetical protein